MLYEGIFFLFLFLSLVSSLLWLVMRGLERLLNINLPFFAHVAAMGTWLVPVVSSDRVLIVFQDNWVNEYRVAARIWLWGTLVCAMVFLTIRLLACHGIRRFAVCEDRRIVSIFKTCTARTGLSRPPALRYARLQTPAVCMGGIRPQVLVDLEILEGFEDRAIEHIFLHELMHIRRRHLMLQAFFDLICCLHWYNPIAWIERRAFSLVCEQDCDARVIFRHLNTERAAYMRTILSALEAGMRRAPWGLRWVSPGISDFRFMKRRMISMAHPDSRTRRLASLVLAIGLLCAYFYFSVHASMGIFESKHPYLHTPVVMEFALQPSHIRIFGTHSKTTKLHSFKTRHMQLGKEAFAKFQETLSRIHNVDT